MKPFYKIIYTSARAFFKIFYRLKIYGLEHYIPGGGILSANHTSFFDPPILSISWPEEVHFLARSSLFRIPFLGFVIRHLNTHPVTGEGGDAAVFKTICKLLSEKKKIILFPEGRRADEDLLQPLKPGVALFLARTGCPVIPAYIHGTFSIWNRFRSFPKLGGKTACIFGSPIYWESFSHLSKKEAQIAVLESLRTSIEGLRAWYTSGAKGVPP